MAELRHAELGGDGARAVITITDAGDDALELGGVEGPRHNELAGLLRKTPPLRLGSQGAEQLEIAAAERLRAYQPSHPHGRVTLDDREQVVGILFIGQRQRADKLPHVLLLLEGAQQLIIGLGERSQVHRPKLRATRRPAQGCG